LSKAEEHRKYIRQEAVKNDKSQSKFSNESSIVKPEKEAIQQANKEKINLDKIVYCPFCLHRAKLIKFLVSDKKGGISTYRARCPECRTGMLMKTVSAMHYMTDKKIESYAQWVCDYRMGFWKKCKKDIWDKRLKEYGWIGIFWKKYKAIKASMPREHGSEEVYYDNDYEKDREERRKQQGENYD